MDISNTLTGLGGIGLSENPLVDRLLERAGQQELLDSLNEVVAVQLISACVSVCSRPGTLSDSQRRIDAPCGIKDVRKGSGPGAARGWEGHARVGSAVAGLTRGLPRGIELRFFADRAATRLIRRCLSIDPASSQTSG